MPTTPRTATLERRARQARADAIVARSRSHDAERRAHDAALTLAALRHAETPLLYKRAEILADDAAAVARTMRRRADAAERRAKRADAALEERRDDEALAAITLAAQQRARDVYTVRAIIAGVSPIPDDDDERERIADAADDLLADGAAMLGHRERDALLALLDALGRGVIEE